MRVGPQETAEPMSPWLPLQLRERLRNEDCRHYSVCLLLAALLHWQGFVCCWKEDDVEGETFDALREWAKGEITKEQVLSRIIHYYLKGSSHLSAEAAREALNAAEFMLEEEWKRREEGGE